MARWVHDEVFFRQLTSNPNSSPEICNHTDNKSPGMWAISLLIIPTLVVHAGMPSPPWNLTSAVFMNTSGRGSPSTLIVICEENPLSSYRWFQTPWGTSEHVTPGQARIAPSPKITQQNSVRNADWLMTIRCFVFNDVMPPMWCTWLELQRYDVCIGYHTY